MHVYMASERADAGVAFHYRGEQKNVTDAREFQRVMKRSGYEVLLRKDSKPGTGKNIPRALFPELKEAE